MRVWGWGKQAFFCRRAALAGALVLMATLTACVSGGGKGTASLAAENAAAATAEESRHAGYYYPAPVTTEVYVSRAQPLRNIERATRLGFVTGLTQQQLSRPYAPEYVLFAKGDDAEKLILISMGSSGFQSLHQARAQLAQLTAISRTSQIFRDYAVEDLFTFLDLARMLGFREITLSDGLSFSHQIEIK